MEATYFGFSALGSSDIPDWSCDEKDANSAVFLYHACI